MAPSYLITGGCGLQGSAIVEKLLALHPPSTGVRVAVLARNPTVNLFPGAEYHKADICVPSEVAAVLAKCKPDVVFHCAGAMTAGRKPVPDDLVRAINVDGTRVMIEESKRAGVKVFVFTSSATVIQKMGSQDVKGADETWGLVTEEDGVDIYPTTMAAAERLANAADDPEGMRTVSLRPAVIYGERDNDIIPGLMANLRAGRYLLQIGNNENLFSTTYVGNAADAHLLAAQKLLSGEVDGVAGESFFITNEEKIPFWDFGRAIWRAAGTDVKPDQIRVISVSLAVFLAYIIEWVAWFKGTRPTLTRTVARYTAMHRYFDISKAKERLGYRPVVDWEEGVRRGVQYFLEHEKTASS